MNRNANKSPKSSANEKDSSITTDDNNDMNISDDEEGGTRIGDIYIPPPIEPHCSTESKGPRLIISNIDIENFKSYAGKVELGPFDHCTSAVIGPNGSGKSNVIDAMLFVFGYRAQKLRLKKLSLLIHSSTSAKQSDCCSVYVHFRLIIDNVDGTFEEVPNSNFIVTRTAYKDNSSFFMVDNKKTHFKEVSKLLKHHGIDLDHNRFLILQGEVESIAMMKPKAQNPNDCGLLEYLEDIIGTSRYKEPLIKINVKVEQLNEERTEKHNRCKMAEREMKDLEQPMEEAVEYLKSENKMTTIKNLQFQKYLFELKQKLVGVELEHVKSMEELEEHEKFYIEIKEKCLEKKKLIKDEMKKYEHLVKEKEENEINHRNAINKIAQLHTTLKAINERRKKAMVQVENEKKKLEELKEMPEKNRAEIIKLEQKIELLNTTKQKQEEVLAVNLANLQNESKDLIEKRDKLQAELGTLKLNVDSCKADLNTAESELKMLVYNHTTESRKLQSCETALEDAESTLIENNTSLATNLQDIDELKTSLTTLMTTYKKLESEEKVLTPKLNALTSEIEENVNSMQASRSNNKVLNALMQQKQTGNIPGILGRLGDLGGIDSKYDVAISTCCGRLDDIIVDKINTAQKCIEYLKTHDVGRANFIALEKVQHLTNQCNSRIQTPENVPRLFDLIRVEDERVRPAFYLALRDTLVSNELEQGTRIAYGRQRFRVVTIKGEVIELSGTMSGGGRSQSRGKMGQSVATKTNTPSRSTKSIEAMQTEAQNIRESIGYIQEQLSAIEADINQSKHSLRIKENEVKKLNLEIKSYTDQMPRLHDQIVKQKEALANCRIDPVQVKEKEQTIEKKKKVFNKSDKEAETFAIQVVEIEKEISKIHESKIKTYQKDIKKLTTEINVNNSAVSKLTVEITTSERNVKKTEDKIEDLNEEILRAQDTIRKDSELRTQTDTIAKECLEKVDAMKKEIETAQSSSSDIKKEIDAIEKQENNAKLKKIEIDEQIKSIEKQKTDIKGQMPNWQRQLKPLKLHDIPNCEPEEPLKTYTEEELNKHTIADLQYQIQVQEDNLNNKKPNLSVIQEYQLKRQNYLVRVDALGDITTKRDEMRKLYEDVRKKRYTEFMRGFHIISKRLKEMYQTITMGGDAELELADSMDPFNEGIIFSVRPPKKSWKQISNLSGGEKTLSSLALVFALHYYKPSPLYVMDEIDAALDFKNVSIVAHYIKQRARNAQFVIISLRSNMFELCDVLVGIYKVRDCSASLAIKNIAPEIIYELDRRHLSQANNNLTQSTSAVLGNDTFSALKRGGSSTSQQELSSIINESILPSQTDLLQITSENNDAEDEMMEVDTENVAPMEI